jgi:hypothetical protein
VGYLLLSMALSVGQHHVRRALSRQSLEVEFCELRHDGVLRRSSLAAHLHGINLYWR